MSSCTPETSSTTLISETQPGAASLVTAASPNTKSAPRMEQPAATKPRIVTRRSGSLENEVIALNAPLVRDAERVLGLPGQARVALDLDRDLA